MRLYDSLLLAVAYLLGLRLFAAGYGLFELCDSERRDIHQHRQIKVVNVIHLVKVLLQIDQVASANRVVDQNWSPNRRSKVVLF